MEARQKYLEDCLITQQHQIMALSKELELHREFLTWHFDSFMDFLFQNGGEMVLNDKDVGLFFRMSKGNEDVKGKDDAANKSGDYGKQREEEQHLTTNDGDHDKDGGNEDDIDMERLLQPQVILEPSSSGDFDNEYRNYHKQMGSTRHDEKTYISRNVVSSSNVQGGDKCKEYVNISGEYKYPSEIGTGQDSNRVLNYTSVRHANTFCGSTNISPVANLQQLASKIVSESNHTNIPLLTSNIPHKELLNFSSKPSTCSSISTALSSPQHPDHQGVDGCIVARRFPCHTCMKRFPSKFNLERHLRVHTGEKPFPCEICGKQCTEKQAVKYHKERVHNVIDDEMV